MKNVGILTVALALGATTLAGCVSGRPFATAEAVRVVTAPAGATVTSEYGDSCITPCSIYLPTADGGVLEIALDGYQTESVPIGHRIDERRVAVDTALTAVEPDEIDLAFGVLSAIIDPGGAQSELDTRQVSMQLVPAVVGYAARGAAHRPVSEPGEGTVIYRLSEGEISAIRRSTDIQPVEVPGG